MSDSRQSTPEAGTAPTVEVGDAPERERYEISVDGSPAGFAAYRAAPGVMRFTHTEIEKRFQGRGLGEHLVAEALDDVQRRGLLVLPFCPFVRSFIEHHPEYLPLVPERRGKAFGL